MNRRLIMMLAGLAVAGGVIVACGANTAGTPTVTAAPAAPAAPVTVTKTSIVTATVTEQASPPVTLPAPPPVTVTVAPPPVTVTVAPPPTAPPAPSADPSGPKANGSYVAGQITAGTWQCEKASEWIYWEADAGNGDILANGLDGVALLPDDLHKVTLSRCQGMWIKVG